MKTTFNIGSASVPPASVGFGKLVCEPTPDAGETFIALTVVNGAQDGPRLWIGSTIHGREMSGIEVCRRVARELVNPHQLCGALVCAMPLNPYGFREQKHTVPQDNGNINAQFPGDQHGTLSQRTANLIWTEGVSHCDYVIDFHANEPGGMEFLCATTCDDLEVQRRTIEMAEAFGFPLVQIRRDEHAYDRSLIGCAMAAGKPAILPEPLGQGILDARSINASVRGVLNVMKLLGMLEGPVETQTDIPVAGGNYRMVNARTRKSGLAEYQVDGGDWVEEGQPIALVRSPWGDEVDRVLAPVSSYVRSVKPYSIVNAGDIVGTLLRPHERVELWGV
jgi:uncharacterized protein